MSSVWADIIMYRRRIKVGGLISVHENFTAVLCSVLFTPDVAKEGHCWSLTSYVGLEFQFILEKMNVFGCTHASKADHHYAIYKLKRCLVYGLMCGKYLSTR